MSEPTEPIAPPPLPQQPVPVMPLGYAHGGVPRPSNFGQQIARASWVAPLVAIVLGFLTMPLRDRDRNIGLFIGILNVLMIAAGFILGIVALAGLRKWGRERVLVPAIVGVSIGGIFIALILMLIPSLNRAKAAAAQQAAASAATQRQAQLAQIRKSGESAALSEGWFGVYNDGTILIAITVVPSDSELGNEIMSNLGEPHRFAVVSVRNGSDATITLDTRRAIIYFSDQTHETAPDPVAVLNTAKIEREEALRTFGPPYTIEPHRDLTKGILFFPDNTNFSNLTHVTVYLNGHATEVPGRIYTAAEKKQLQEAAKQAGVAQ